MYTHTHTHTHTHTQHTHNTRTHTRGERSRCTRQAREPQPLRPALAKETHSTVRDHTLYTSTLYIHAQSPALATNACASTCVCPKACVPHACMPPCLLAASSACRTRANSHAHMHTHRGPGREGKEVRKQHSQAHGGGSDEEKRVAVAVEVEGVHSWEKGDGGGDKGKEDAGVVGETRDVPCSLVACYPCMCAGCHALRTRAAPCAHRLATEAPHARSHGQWRQCAAAPVLSTAVLCASHTQHCQRVTQDSMPTGRKSAKEAAG